MPADDIHDPGATVFVPTPGGARALRDAFGAWPTGVTVVTARGLDGAAVGITANSFASVSLDPPLVLWSPGKFSSRHGHFTAARHFAIHVLTEAQGDLAARFVRGGAGFAGLPHAENAAGVPLLAGVLARFECRTETCHDAGDHTLVIGHVERVAHRLGRPLCFAAGRYGRLAPPV
ncbi:flavin reductase family protein [Ruixingdingia sedimenti]|uniref:Flavin reductase family protein n=1 Tax=Ruixingdingia sedimenti TaxID=3073604 RepID=A0ABU1F2L8_9RHOB|nr:flavin reductase family protein [Xinfangfangia sp. LG-4]MDR5651109.1 flavin reductase family protein [Xinfangfangia sp. LG-4]